MKSQLAAAQQRHALDALRSALTGLTCVPSPLRGSAPVMPDVSPPNRIITRTSKATMTDNSLGTVSVLGPNLLEPILSLVEQLESTPLVEPNEVQAAPQENGSSCAIVTLNALLLESAMNRTRYIRREICDDDLIDYFAKVTSNAELAKDIDEVIAVRDAVVHNHLWEADVYWDENLKLNFRSPPKLLEGFGNKRQRRVMDPKTRLSRRLHLNLYPLRIWRRDAYVSLRVVSQALESLEAKDQNYFVITRLHFKFRGNLRTLKQVIDTLPYTQKAG